MTGVASDLLNDRAYAIHMLHQSLILSMCVHNLLLAVWQIGLWDRAHTAIELVHLLATLDVREGERILKFPRACVNTMDVFD